MFVVMLLTALLPWWTIGACPSSRDPDLVMPGVRPFDPGELLPATVDEPAFEVATDTEVATDSDDNATQPQLLTVCRDYFALLQHPQTDGHVLGVLNGILNIMGDLWDEGFTCLVGSLARHFASLDVSDYGMAAQMSCQVLRRFSAGYLQGDAGMALPDYWQRWFEMAVTRLLEDSTYDDASSHHDQHPHTADSSFPPSDESGLMQVDGRRLTMSERMVRPRRPQEWLELMSRLRSMLPMIQRRTFGFLRSWITARLNRVGYMFISLGLMLRDTLHADEVEPLPTTMDAQAKGLAQVATEALGHYLDRTLRSELHPMQSFVIQEGLKLAVRMDELDVNLFPMEDGMRAQLDMEEIHLMYRVNNLIREHLKSDEASRDIRVCLIKNELRNMMGSEARHLRRIGTCLHGVQMLGHGPCPDATTYSEDNAEWLSHLMDDAYACRD